MNVFPLEKKPDGDIDWVKSAQSQDDLRVVKMTLETTQLLCSGMNVLSGSQITPYKTAHKNHPSTIWARASFANWLNLKRHGLALAGEYTKRFGKVHKCEKVMRSLQPDQWLFPQLESTPLPLCMPNHFKSDDTVQSYRLFWVSKPNMRYRRANPPSWFIQMRTKPYEKGLESFHNRKTIQLLNLGEKNDSN